MNPNGVSPELLLRVRQDRQTIAGELESLHLQHERLQEAAAEDTLSGHLRQAIHASHRPLRELARAAGLETESLCDFLEGQRSLSSEALDRLARAAGIVVTVSRGTTSPGRVD
jgi:hypothetical protein